MGSEMCIRDRAESAESSTGLITSPISSERFFSFFSLYLFIMLLYDNYFLLLQLFCGLHQASFSFTRSFLHNGEITARLQNQLWFISVCLRRGIFPPTVGNLPLPACISEASQRGIRTDIMKRMKRGLRVSLEAAKRKLRQFNNSLSNLPANDKEKLQQGRNEAFDNSYRRASGHFRNKLRWLDERQGRRGVHSEAHEENSSVTSRRVTDNTQSLSDAERDLLSRGPKFALAVAINEGTRETCRTSFARFAYQYRWSASRGHEDDSASAEGLFHLSRGAPTCTCLPPTPTRRAS